MRTPLLFRKSICFWLFISLETLTPVLAQDNNQATAAADDSLNVAASDVSPRERRVEECGVEAYNAREDQLCGVAAYTVARSASCGVELYHERTSSECPGYRPASSYDISKTTTCGGSEPRDVLQCKDGEERRGYHSVSEGCWRSITRRSHKWVATARCHIPEVIHTCRRPQWGIERYHRCAHASHGVARYQSCARPEFGVARYRSCLIRATKDEIVAKLAAIRSHSSAFALKLLQFQAEYYASDNSDKAMSCLIERYSADPLHEDLVDDLKTLFANTFNRSFKTGEFSCDDALLAIQQCDEKDLSKKCSIFRSYKATRTWFETQVNDLELIKNDIVANGNPSAKADIEQVQSNLRAQVSKAPRIIMNRLINLKKIVPLIRNDIGTMEFRYELITSGHDGGTNVFKGVVNKDEVSFPVGEKIREAFKSCRLKVWGPDDGKFRWETDAGLYYESPDCDLSTDEPNMTIYRKFIRVNDN